MNDKRLACSLLAAGIGMSLLAPLSAADALPKVIYPNMRQNAAPANGMDADLNPEILKWPSSSNRKGRYKAELSQDPEFKKDVLRSGELNVCFFNPHRKLASGTWYWRYQVSSDKNPKWSKTNSFVIHDDTTLFVTPSIDEIIAKLPKRHPYMLTQGRDPEELRKAAQKYPQLIAKTEQAAKSPRAGLSQIAKAFLLTGDKKYVKMAHDKAKAFIDKYDKKMNIMTEAFDMRALCEAYDAFYHEFDEPLKKAIQAQVRHYLNKNLWWRGNRENVFLENHFWQAYVSGVFISALATVHEVPEAKESMAYTYGIFLARGPVAGGRDGGWANGLPYFTVNYQTIATMGHYLYSLCNVDIYQKPWFKNLPEYYLLCGGIYAPMDGFGNMHDRVYMFYKQNGKSWNFGKPVCENIAIANDDPIAKLYFNQDWDGVTFEQLAAGKNLKMSDAQMKAVTVPQSRQFRDVGVTAMHTDVLNPRKDMAVYFRSSPFGVLGHMHANQNVFNIAYKGERVFYSSGFYTEFLDKHVLTSYRHTRAHNGILVDGKGQSMDTGYGWLKRYASGGKVSYVCGDASRAYGDINGTWLKRYMSDEELKASFGDAKLNAFNRHVIFLRPGTVLVYDELDSAEPHNWTWMLHTYKKPELDADGVLRYTTLPGIAARAEVFASAGISAKMTDQYFVDPRDKNSRYKNAPNQYHISWESTQKSKAFRFFAVIQCAGKEQELAKVEKTGDGSFKVGDYKINVVLNPDKPAALSVTAKDCGVFVNDIPRQYLGVTCQQPEAGKNATLVVESLNGKVTQSLTVDVPPAVAYLF